MMGSGSSAHCFRHTEQHAQDERDACWIAHSERWLCVCADSRVVSCSAVDLSASALLCALTRTIVCVCVLTHLGHMHAHDELHSCVEVWSSLPALNFAACTSLLLALHPLLHLPLH